MDQNRHSLKVQYQNEDFKSTWTKIVTKTKINNISQYENQNSIENKQYLQIF